MPSTLRIAAACLVLAALPLSAAARPARPAPRAPAAPVRDWTSSLRAEPRFSIFVKAMDDNGLTARVRGMSDLTVFAPTDEAFNALSAGQLAWLTSPAGAAQLRKVLVQLIVAKTLEPTVIRGSQGQITSIGGAPVSLNGGGDAITVNGVETVQPDIHIPGGGVIYVLARVPIPADVTFPPTAK
jgi:uncharacterized surface protein with fasciclin (FAS1) repeats